MTATTQRQATPFQPTVDPATRFPTTCYTCARHATGIGLKNPAHGDPAYICEECALLLDTIKSIRSWSPLERAAIARAVDAVGPFVRSHGSDLAEWEEETAEEFIRAIWGACADGLRAVIREREVPF